MGYTNTATTKEDILKSLKDLLKRKPKPDPTIPETMPATVDPAAQAEAEKPGMLATWKAKIFGGKKDEAQKDGDDVSSLEMMKQKLSSLVAKRNDKHTRNKVLIVAGGGLAVVGMAADFMFLGGMATATVAGMIYSDYRNAQHIDKISQEISKIDQKIDELKTGQHPPANDYAPALAAVKSSIEDFQASAQKVPAEVAGKLDALKNQVTALQDKIGTPSNDDKKPQAPAIGG